MFNGKDPQAALDEAQAAVDTAIAALQQRELLTGPAPVGPRGGAAPASGR